jgi:hypothetical protein
MHAVLITFTSAAPVEELAEPFAEYARALCSVEGLISKTWIRDGDIVGGFHIFTTGVAAEAYLGSEMVAGLTSNPAFSGFAIRHFDTIDELSAITGSPRVPLAV